jgi:elongation factor P
MILITDVKEGMALKIEDRLYRVLEVVRHAGSGQMHGFVELKLKEMQFGHFSDRRFKQSDRVEEVSLSKRPMEFIYSDKDTCYFMDPQTYNQIGVPKTSVGKLDKLLKEGMKITVELVGEEAVSIQFPKVVELAVEATGPGIRDSQDNSMKSATLENGLEILVPQFIESGDRVHVDTDKLKYLDRVSTKRI